MSYVFSGSVIPTPTNYGGEIGTKHQDNIEKGKWYFSIDDKVLLYMLNSVELLDSGFEETAQLQFKIKLNYTDNNANGTFEENIDKYNSVKLQLINKT